MIVIVMGVSGCGKTSLGRALALDLGLPFRDGDDFHGESNRAKMARGEGLTDEDRRPWLEALNALILADEESGGCVLACSALKESYRSILARGCDPLLAYLAIGPEEAAARVGARKGHYMPASLIPSQFAALEEPAGALRLDAMASPESLRDRVLAAIKGRIA